MKKIDITGNNYLGSFSFSRTTCRAIIIKDGKILLSYETKTNTYMIPGGGIEKNETDSLAVIREVAEETGYLIKPKELVLEIDEYYENKKYINKYFCAEIVGKTERKLTEEETRNGLEPTWLSIEEIESIFAHHQDYAGVDEMRSGLYLREYTALKEIIK